MYVAVFVLFQSLVQLFDTPAGRYIPEDRKDRWHATDVLFEDVHGQPAPLQTSPHAINVNTAAIQGVVQFVAMVIITAQSFQGCSDRKTRTLSDFSMAAKRSRYEKE